MDRVAKDVINKDHKSHADLLQKQATEHMKRVNHMDQFIDFAVQVNTAFLAQRKTGRVLISVWLSFTLIFTYSLEHRLQFALLTKKLRIDI